MRRTYILAVVVYILMIVPVTYALLLLGIWSFMRGESNFESVVETYWNYDFPAINAGLIYIGLMIIFAWAKEQEEKYQEQVYRNRYSLNKLDTSWLL